MVPHWQLPRVVLHRVCIARMQEGGQAGLRASSRPAILTRIMRRVSACCITLHAGTSEACQLVFMTHHMLSHVTHVFLRILFCCIILPALVYPLFQLQKEAPDLEHGCDRSLIVIIEHHRY